MAALVTGTPAPDFTLKTIDGGEVRLQELLQRGPVVLAFFKVSCPVCQFAFPFYERLAQAHRGSGVAVLGVCQNGVREAQAFAREYGLTFPIAIDNDANRYAVSNAYGLTNVPTVFYVAQSGEIEVSSVGWMKSDLEDVNARLNGHDRDHLASLWHQGEDIPAFRAG